MKDIKEKINTFPEKAQLSIKLLKIDYLNACKSEAGEDIIKAKFDIMAYLDCMKDFNIIDADEMSQIYEEITKE